jgi:hypothetical protein
MTRLIPLVVAVLFVLSTTARAEDRATARDHFQRGRKAFDLAHYDQAITEYSLAYELHDDPVLLYDIALAHRAANRLADALRFYRMYLVKYPKAPNRDEVATKIDDLRKLIDQQERMPSAPPTHPITPGTSEPEPGAQASAMKPQAPASPQATTPKPAEPSAAQPSPSSVATPSHTSDDNTRVATSAHAIVRARVPDLRAARVKQTAGLVVGVLGLGALGAGAGFAVLAKRTSDELDALNGSGRPWDPARYDAGRTDQALAATLIAVGAAATVSGVVVFALGRREATVHF